MGSSAPPLIAQRPSTIMKSNSGWTKRHSRVMIVSSHGAPWVWKRILLCVPTLIVTLARSIPKEVSSPKLMPTPGTNVIAASAPIVTCYVCHHRTCFTHQVAWHDGYTCDEWDQHQMTRVGMATTAEYLTKFTKMCPRCKKPVSAQHHYYIEILIACRLKRVRVAMP